MNKYAWTESYRPNTVNDVILPSYTQELFKEYVEKGSIPNLLLVGKPGVGKTTIAKALCNDLDYESIVINASLYGNIDTLRVDILQFVTSSSFLGKRKCVILDEADHLNPSSTQPALRNFLDEYSSKVTFILTANWKEKIIEPLRSRFSEISFVIPKVERNSIAKRLFVKIKDILEKENVKAEDSVIKEAIQTYFPDFRKILTELEANIVRGEINSSMFIDKSQYGIDDLIKSMTSKNFTEVRKIVASNGIPSEYIYNYFYKNANKIFIPQSIPQMILIIAKYQYQDVFVVDKEINLVACLAEIMADCLFLT